MIHTQVKYTCYGLVQWPDLDGTLYGCVGCSRKKRPAAFDCVDVKAYNRNPKKKTLLCLECTAKGCSVRDTKLYHCALCGKELGRSNFKAKDLTNFQQGQDFRLQCTECHGLWGSSSFLPKWLWGSASCRTLFVFLLEPSSGCASTTSDISIFGVRVFCPCTETRSIIIMHWFACDIHVCVNVHVLFLTNIVTSLSQWQIFQALHSCISQQLGYTMAILSSSLCYILYLHIVHVSFTRLFIFCSVCGAGTNLSSVAHVQILLLGCVALVVYLTFDAGSIFVTSWHFSLCLRCRAKIWIWISEHCCRHWYTEKQPYGKKLFHEPYTWHVEDLWMMCI